MIFFWNQGFRKPLWATSTREKPRTLTQAHGQTKHYKRIGKGGTRKVKRSSARGFAALVQIEEFFAAGIPGGASFTRLTQGLTQVCRLPGFEFLGVSVPVFPDIYRISHGSGTTHQCSGLALESFNFIGKGFYGFLGKFLIKLPGILIACRILLLFFHQHFCKLFSSLYSFT